MIDIIGVPLDLCGKRPGARLGPAAIRLTGLNQALTNLKMEVCDRGDVLVDNTPRDGSGIRCFEEACPAIKEVQKRVSASIKSGNTPLVLGGDHSIAIGAVSGALDVVGSDLSLLWLDAHTDLNTPATTPSGNLHGMPVAALLAMESGVTGEVDRQWSTLLPQDPLRAERLAYFGTRDIDPGEQAALCDLHGCYTATMHEIDRHGIVSCMQRFDHWMRHHGSQNLWISFDVDMLDPFLAPGTGTTVRGGLTYRESHLVAELLRELLDKPGCPYKLVGLDLVETNPIFDHLNETAITAAEWIASLFGKCIIGKR